MLFTLLLTAVVGRDVLARLSSEQPDLGCSSCQACKDCTDACAGGWGFGVLSCYGECYNGTPCECPDGCSSLETTSDEASACMDCRNGCASGWGIGVLGCYGQCYNGPSAPCPSPWKSLEATTDDGCLTPQQDQTLRTTILSIDATLQLTVTSLNIAAMWQQEPMKGQLTNSSRIIGAVADNLVPQMIKITEETCGTCDEISKGVQDIVDALTKTLSASVPEWKSNPIFNSVTTAVTTIVNLVPDFCPAKPTLEANEQCLTAAQKSQLQTSVTAISTTLTLTSTALTISGAFQSGAMKTQLTQAGTIIGAINSQLVSKLTPITEETCGSCAQISEAVEKIVQALDSTMSSAVPAWKSNPVFTSVTTAVNGILGIVPNFCPTPTQFLTHQC